MVRQKEIILKSRQKRKISYQKNVKRAFNFRFFEAVVEIKSIKWVDAWTNDVWAMKSNVKKSCWTDVRVGSNDAHVRDLQMKIFEKISFGFFLAFRVSMIMMHQIMIVFVSFLLEASYYSVFKSQMDGFYWHLSRLGIRCANIFHPSFCGQTTTTMCVYLLRLTKRKTCDTFHFLSNWRVVVYYSYIIVDIWIETDRFRM